MGQVAVGASRKILFAGLQDRHASLGNERRRWDEDVAEAAKAVPGFERLTFHSCRHGFATKMLRDGMDPKTAAWLGGWDDVSLFMDTYAHAIEDPALNERIFDIGHEKKRRGRK